MKLCFVFDELMQRSKTVQFEEGLQPHVKSLREAKWHMKPRYIKVARALHTFERNSASSSSKGGLKPRMKPLTLVQLILNFMNPIASFRLFH